MLWHYYFVKLHTFLNYYNVLNARTPQKNAKLQCIRNVVVSCTVKTYCMLIFKLISALFDDFL